MADEQFANLAEKTGKNNGGGQQTRKFTMRVKVKGHALYGGFCRLGNIQNPFVIVALSRLIS